VATDAVPSGLILNQPADVAAGSPILVAGTYGSHDSVDLQIERLEDGVWADFPETAQVSMGHFSATITSSMTGPNQFRVFDHSQNRASNTVTVYVH
jgi:hypothetical protein